MADLPGLVWRRSSFSGGDGGTNCVEVALPGGMAAVRDSLDPSEAVLRMSRSAWLSLLDSVERC
jgi:hypothetical protein